MKCHLKKLFVGLFVFWFLIAPVNTFAFALLGPIQPWIQATNRAFDSDVIGDPMEIGSGYRWNVPVLTYGFDKSFVDFFGTSGVAAVQGAIQILNDLPPASNIAITNYPFNSQSYNATAQALFLLNLKSLTLSLLLEHMGLAQPTRSIYVLRQWSPRFIPISMFQYISSLDWDPWAYPDFITQLNFDPQSLTASDTVNNILYGGFMITAGNLNGIYTIPLDANISPSYSAVADRGLYLGGFYTGLTYDDVGGLAYLLSTNTINYETLLPGVAGAGTNLNSFVNGAWRPGVDKITFVPQPMDVISQTFLPLTNNFTDHYLTNGILRQQQLARVISQPDFLFSANDVNPNMPRLAYVDRTGTTNWLNNSAANGNTNGAGPGVIPPPVQFVFNKLGQRFESYLDEPAFTYSATWASFDNTTNSIIVYPVPKTGTNQMTVRIWLLRSPNYQKSFEWKLNSLSGAQFDLQTSTNLNDWTTLFTLTNNGSVNTYLPYAPLGASRFYRLVPQ